MINDDLELSGWSGNAMFVGNCSRHSLQSMTSTAMITKLRHQDVIIT